MDKTRYKPFHETYKLTTFAMSMALIYPNPEKRKKRLLLSAIQMLSATPLCFMILVAIHKSWAIRDISNIFKQSTIIGPFLGGFFKMFLMFYYEKNAKKLLDELNTDYALYSNLSADHQAIVDNDIRNNHIYAERAWLLVISFCCACFPSSAAALNVYSHIFEASPIKYMVHDVTLPFTEPETRFLTPYFEIVFIYMTYATLLYLIHFVGFDIFFGLCINHACLKMKMYCKAMEDAMKVKTEEEMYERVVQVIQSQWKLFSYVDTIQRVFNLWIGVVLVASMVQICTCLYYITEGFDMEPKYIVYTLGTIAYVYLPCRYSSKLKSASAEVATMLYCCGWETVRARWARRALLFMMARAQRPAEIVAFNMFVFDMQRFVSILQTSYSMYTLLRS